jgi:hypothetical protein
VLDTFGTKHNAPANASALMVGSFFGGAGVAELMLNDTRVRGGVNLDGELFGKVLDIGLGQSGAQSILYLLRI